MEIPKFIQGEEVIEWEEVDEEWYSHIENSRGIADSLWEDYRGRPTIRGLERSISDETIAGLRKNIIRIFVEPDSELVEELPDQVEDIPIEVDAESMFHDSHYQQAYDPICGGVQVSSNSGSMTSTCTVGSREQKQLLIARHPFTSSRCGLSLRNNTRVFQDGDYFGNIVDDWQRHDVALCELDPSGSRKGFTDTIVDQQGIISGHVAGPYVEYLKSSQKIVHKRSISSGRTQGTIQSTGGILRCRQAPEDLDELVQTDTPQDAGDSGSPVYYLDESHSEPHIYIVHTATQAKTPRMILPGDAYGAAAWFIHQKTGIRFDL